MGRTEPRGVIPAIPTPFTADGRSVDEDALRRVVRHVVDGGVHGMMTTGGTGEFPHLSRDERRRVAEVVAEETDGAVPIFAGTAACSTLEAVALMEDAAGGRRRCRDPCPAVLLPPSRRDALRLLRRRRSGRTCSRSSSTTIRSTRETPGPVPDRLVDGGRERHRAQAVGRRPRATRRGAAPGRGSGRSLCTGIDSQFYAALCVGAQGIFSTAAAIVPAQIVWSVDLHRRATTPARSAQHQLLQPLNRFLEYDPGYVSPTKEALEMMGISCGPVRRPLPDFPENERPALRDALVALGALEAVPVRLDA